MIGVFSLLLACGPDAATVAEQLRSENPAVREDTARRARNFDSPEVVEGLILSLDDSSEKVRSFAVDSLIALDAKAAVPRLAEHMATDASPLVRRQCIDAVGRLGDPVAVPALIALLESTEQEGPPLNAIWALGQLGDMRALAVLSRLRDHSDPFVAYNANQALRRLRPSS